MVEVRIADAQGREVLQVSTSDSLLFAQLRPRNDQVAAPVDGRTIERKVMVRATGMHNTELIPWRYARTAGAPR